MDEDHLNPLFQSVLSSFKDFKQQESFYIIASNLYDSQSMEIDYRLNPVPIVTSEIEITSAPIKAFSTTYIRTSVNIAAKEKDHLDFIPFDESSNKVYFSQDLDIYKTNPFNQSQHAEEFTFNKQFNEFLVLSLLKICPIKEDWMKASSFLADKLGKSKRLMMQVFNEAIDKHLFNEKELVKKQDFKNNFCQICLRYACATHFFEDSCEAETETPALADPHIREQYKEDVMTIIDPENWKVSWWSNLKNIEKSGRWFQGFRCKDNLNCSRTTVNFKKTILPFQEQLIKTFLKKGLNNPCAISLLALTPCKVTAAYVGIFEKKYVKPLPIAKLPRKVFYTSSLFDNKVLITNVIETHCKCKYECSIRNKCPCLIGDISGNTVIARRCCEKYCLCNLDCKQRFLGCSCQYGKCDSKTCVCLVNQRECDPELCIFCCSILSTKSNHHPRKKNRFLCLNLRNQLRIIKKTAMGQSNIQGAGMGLFTLESCVEGDYLTEYTGEIIGEAESERRAAVYDYRHHSFIFSLSPDTRWAIDSTYYGSKMRYVNHKSHDEHNTFTQVWLVRGQVKILLFAAEKLSAGQELYFDYGYDSKEIKYVWLQEYEKKFKNKKPKNRF